MTNTEQPKCAYVRPSGSACNCTESDLIHATDGSAAWLALTSRQRELLNEIGGVHSFVPPADVPDDKWGPCAAWAAGPNPCGKPASDPVHRGHPFITREKYNAVRVRDGLPPIEFPADVPAATRIQDCGTHVCKNGSLRNYAAVLCSMCRPDEVPIVVADTRKCGHVYRHAFCPDCYPSPATPAAVQVESRQLAEKIADTVLSHEDGDHKTCASQYCEECHKYYACHEREHKFVPQSCDCEVRERIAEIESILALRATAAPSTSPCCLTSYMAMSDGNGRFTISCHAHGPVAPPTAAPSPTEPCRHLTGICQECVEADKQRSGSIGSGLNWSAPSPQPSAEPPTDQEDDAEFESLWRGWLGRLRMLTTDQGKGLAREAFNLGREYERKTRKEPSLDGYRGSY